MNLKETKIKLEKQSDLFGKQNLDNLLVIARIIKGKPQSARGKNTYFFVKICS